MEAEPIRWRADELLAQAEWLGALARRLVDDASQADDLVQDTWLAALRRPPERGRAVKPWLARVVRNAARTQRRGDAARSSRERAQTAPVESSSPDELAVKFEGQRLLIDALARLPEPYRATILLAYFERLPSDEIARRQGVAAGTVRWRIKVGLDALRAELDRGPSGDRRAWTLALAPLVRDSRHAAATPAVALPLQGVVIVQTLLKVGAALAAVAIVVTALALSGAFPGLTAGSARETPVAVRMSPIDTRPASVPRASEELVDARAATAAAEARVRGEDESHAAPSTECSVEARIVDRSGRPIASATLRTRPGELSQVRSTRAGVDGFARLELALGDSSLALRLEALAPGFATRAVEANVAAGVRVELGELALDVGGNVSGRVVDADGRPLEHVGVTLADAKDPQSELDRRRRAPLAAFDRPSSSTAADGSFVLEGAPVGFIRVAAGLDGWLNTFSAPVEVREGYVSDGVELVLEPLDLRERIEGIVLDPEGRAVASAYVEYRVETEHSAWSGAVNADASGRFRIMANRREPHDLRAIDSSGTFAAAALDGVEPGTLDAVLRFGLPSELAIVVRAIGGEAITAYVARAFDPDVPGIETHTGSGPHDVGRASLPAPAKRFVVDVDAPGFDLGRQGPFEDAAPNPLEFVLTPMPVAHGRVLAHGSPVANADIRVFPRFAGSIQRDGFRCAYEPIPVVTGVSSADGAFELTVRKRGDYVVRFEADDLAPAELDLASYDPRVGRDDLVAELVEGGEIVVRVRAGSRDPTGTIVAFTRGDGFPFTRRVGAEGTCHVEHLTPGRWEVRRVERELQREVRQVLMRPGRPWDEIPSNCEVFDGRVTPFELVLDEAAAPSVVRGRLTVDGALPGPWSVELMSAPFGVRSEALGAAKLDGRGRFELDAKREGAALVALTALTGELDGLRVVAPTTVAAGVNEWSLDLRTARVALENVRLNRSEEPSMCVVSIAADGMFAVRPIASDGDSQFVVPAGRLKLWKFDDKALSVPPEQWPASAEAVVEPGGSAVLRMP
jgi:RNA polymerase sigma-70 factor (ECF subfamily)